MKSVLSLGKNYSSVAWKIVQFFGLFCLATFVLKTSNVSQHTRLNRRQDVDQPNRFHPGKKQSLDTSTLRQSVKEDKTLNWEKYDDQEIEARHCQPKKKFGFMKTHKTGSSTVQHRLLLYGYNNNLNVILPKAGNYVNNPKHQYILDEPFRIEWLNGVPWHADFVKNNAYDIQALHTMWNHTAYRSLLGPSAVFSTLLRNPIDTFESQYSFYNLDSQFGMNISTYLKELERNDTLRFQRHRTRRGLNPQSWDLGLKDPELENHNAIEAKIKSMEKEFDLVMINEFMDESLVLLAHLLCLPLSTMVGLKLNQRKSKVKVQLTKEESDTLKRFQLSDEMIYSHFYQKFLVKWDEFGRQRMEKAVHKLQQWNREIEERCVQNYTDRASLKGTMFAPFSGDVIAFKIRDDDEECKMMGITELNLISLIQEKQRKRWLESLWNGKLVGIFNAK